MVSRMRQIILDTETTGLRTEDGHRVIEIGCVEMTNRKLTGRTYHVYLNPERQVEAGAMAVHGITDEFLQDKPVFSMVADEFMDFISDSELIIHNAPFDLAFLNNELRILQHKCKSIAEYCSIIDTLQLARKLHVGQRNSLDALCKRYKIDNSKRDMHGALLDANLLTLVYLAMTGGQGSFFDLSPSHQDTQKANTDDVSIPSSLPKHQLIVLRASANELIEHTNYLELLKKQGKCVWDDG